MSKQIGDITLYTVLELSKLLDVTEVTLRRYIKGGKLKATMIAGKYHISQENVEALLKDGETRPDNEETIDAN